ncbi:hypothetical protein G6011_03405 [Alternaria panax]|uniref:Uncharacterized protein n=1 Tax=Alternaria panax TaxID=48097 RepID=A0AAD4IF49_9PLEO|nr:hypothetical protein G6011_03405 [Alternaria panax]
MRRQFPSSGEGAFDDSNDRAQSLRATAWSRSFQHTPEVFERPRQSGHSRSVSEPRDSITSSNRRDDAPQKATTYPGCGDDVPQSAVTDPSYDYDAPRSTVDNPNHDDNVAERYSHIPEHIRQHPRFEEVAYAAEMIEKFEEQDPRAKSFEKLLEEIIEEINKDIGDL